MSPASLQHNDDTATASGTGSTRGRRFFSLKWKVAILLTLLLLAVNAGLAYLGYINFEHQFDRQLQQAVTRSSNAFNSLLMQARTNLQNLGESLGLDAGESGSSVDKLTERLQNNWDVMQLNWGLESAAIFDAKGHALHSFGSAALQAGDAALAKNVARYSEPDTAVRCEQQCLLVAAVPILLKNGDLYILVLKSSIADLIIDFSRGNADGSALLSQSSTVGRETPWGYRITAAIQRKHDRALLRQAAARFKLKQLLNAGVWFYAADGYAYHLHAIPIDSRPAYSDKTLLVLIENISTQRATINQHIRQHIAAAAVGMLASEALLLFILWMPMQRIKRQADILPRLAHGDYLQASAVACSDTSRATRDELDVLEDATFELSQRLNKLSIENEERARELEYMALYDHLTGLANRRLFLDHLTQAAYEYERSEEKFAVLFFDLDNFKRVNDSFGHDVGDELLKQVAQQLRDHTRTTDTVARLSGDEFTVLLRHLNDADTLLHIVEKIRRSLQIPVAVSATQIIVTPSIGIVTAPDNGLEPDQLLRNADVAMYEAKRAGGNSYYFFTEEINYKAIQLLRLESELREALDKRQFYLLYQPLVNLSSMQIVGMEALVRWRHPEVGTVAPDRFIGIMENNGMIVELGAQVVAQACRDLALLRDCKSAFTISVNFSPRQLHDRGLVEALQWQLRSNQVDPRRLKIEITENSLIEDVDDNIDILNQLKEMGLALSIDDFGTGYSSLSYLKMLPVDELKVDRRFISDITMDRDDREITAAVIAMAHKLQLKVVAEGIETVDQLDFLRRNLCDIGQGYLFSKPVPFDDIQQMLRDGVAPLRCGV